MDNDNKNAKTFLTITRRIYKKLKIMKVGLSFTSSRAVT